jgi:hypothetical protein
MTHYITVICDTCSQADIIAAELYDEWKQDHHHEELPYKLTEPPYPKGAA